MNRASGGDRTPVELFQILKDDTVKVLHAMSANLENSAVVTGLENVSFHSNPQERQCQRMLKLLCNYTHFTCQQNNAQNPSSQASTVCELRASRYKPLEKAEEPEIRLPTSIGVQKKQRNSRKASTSASLTMLKPLTVWITTNWKILKEMGIPDHFTCLLRNLYAGKEVTVRTRHGIADGF